MVITRIKRQLKQVNSSAQRWRFRRQLYQNSQPLSPSPKPMIVFAPHQDDETLGCGGLMALKQQLGAPIWVVFVTDGRKCYPQEIALPAEQCVHMRQQEALRALQVLGIKANQVIFLTHHDGSLKQLEAEAQQQAIAELTAILRRLQPQEIYVPYRNDGHSDHVKTYGLVKAAAESSGLRLDFWEYFVWSLWKTEYLAGAADTAAGTAAGTAADTAPQLYRLPIHPVRQQKAKALRCYRSQYQKIDQFQVLPPGFMRFFSAPYEMFLGSKLIPLAEAPQEPS
jgi:N-acetylglucosamine malate deacetylase 1